MRILVDVDGVQADLVPAFLHVLTSYWGRIRTADQWTDWDPVKCGLCADEEQARMAFHLIGPDVRTFPYIPGALQGVSALRADGHQVVALTAPIFQRDWLYGRAMWLSDIGYNDRTIVFTRDKTLVPGDVLIEDNPAYATAWAKANPRGLALLFDQPWNQKVSELPPNTLRVHGWGDALDTIGWRSP